MSMRILVVDDHEPGRRAICSLLKTRSDWEVVAEAADGAEAAEKARQLSPDIVLMDLRIPQTGGADATRTIRGQAPDSQVILVSQNDPDVLARLAAAVGAAGYVSKASLGQDLLPAIDVAIAARERRQAEHTRALLAAIVDSSEDAIISKNLDGNITSWNKGAESIFGYTAQEAVGQHITLIIPPDRHSEENEILSRLRRCERIEHFETVRRHRDGTLLDVSVTISPLRDATGKVIGASKVARDITEHKRAEENYHRFAKRLEREVRARTQKLEERNAEVESQSAQLRELSSRLLGAQDEERRRVARELHDSAGQTLNVLSLKLGLLMAKAGQSDSDLVTVAEQANEIVKQLAREIRTTSYLLHPPLLDEAGLPDALSWYVQGLSERSGVRMELEIPEGFERLLPEMELVIFRVVQECLTNILRHARSKTALVRIESQDDQIVMTVRDQGRGIPRERLTAIESGESGVGFRGMRERLRPFHGELSIDSSAAGTTIRVMLPVSRESRGRMTKSESAAAL